MKTLDHLSSYDLYLVTKSPLHVGNGRSYTKTEYIFNPNTLDVGILDEYAFIRYLVENGLMDRYEKFILSDRGDKRLYPFLTQECGMTNKEIDSLIQYKLYAGYALDDTHTLKEVYSFVRDTNGKAYIPGSSLKGALRTVILQQMILSDGGSSSIDREIPEGKYLNTLRCSLDRDTGLPKNDAVNSIMRGISISDSDIIPNSDFTISIKIDTDIHGYENAINLCRECVAPGVKIHFKLTLDSSVLHDTVTADTLRIAISEYGRYYEKTYVSHFERPKDDSGESYRNCIVLGGGAGFFSKSLAYPYLGEIKALKYVSDRLDYQFKNRSKNGKSDTSLGISPHMLKYAEYKRLLYPYGVCEVIIK